MCGGGGEGGIILFVYVVTFGLHLLEMDKDTDQLGGKQKGRRKNLKTKTKSNQQIKGGEGEGGGGDDYMVKWGPARQC